MSLALAQVGATREEHPEGKTLEQVLIVREDVFGEDDLFPLFLNMFHWRTQEQVVRREVLLREGQVFDQKKLEETERNLRGLFILTAARVVPVKGSREDTYSLLIVTKDKWSLRLNNDFLVAGGALQYLQLELIEANFLGLGQAVSIDFDLQRSTFSLGQTFSERRLFGSAIGVSESAAMILNRSTGAFEGGAVSVAVAKSLLSLDQEWAYGISGSLGSSRARAYRGNALRLLPYPDAEAPTATVPYQYNVHTLATEANVTRSFGQSNKTNVTAGIGAYDYRYTVPRASNLNDEQAAWFQANYLPRSETATYLVARATFFTAEYRVFHNLDTFSLSEDYQVGPRFFLGARWAIPTVSPTRYLVTGAAARYRWVFDDNFLEAAVAGVTRFIPLAGFFNRRVVGQLLEVSPPIGGGRLVGRFIVDLIDQDLNHRQLTLGGDNGLRGADVASISGRNTLLLNLEYRTRPIVIETVHVGFVLFYDMGSAFDTTPSPVHTFGLGARILIPQFNRETIRLDFGFVLGAQAQPGLDRFSLGWGQVTDLRPGFLDSPL